MTMQRHILLYDKAFPVGINYGSIHKSPRVRAVISPGKILLRLVLLTFYGGLCCHLSRRGLWPSTCIPASDIVYELDVL